MRYMNKLTDMISYISRVISYNLKERTWRKRLMSDWSFRVWHEEKEFSKCVANLYTQKYQRKESLQSIVFISDDKWISGGICDKFRGIVSLYLLCEDEHLPFKISWTYPFHLSDYLSPNNYDWLYKDDISRDNNCKPIQTMSYHSYFDVEEKTLQKRRLEHLIKEEKHYREVHVYTNAHFGDGDFNRIFSLLFKPSPKLSSLLGQYLPKEKYISMSFRFMQLLGDFEDRAGGIRLEYSEIEEYLKKSIILIETMHLKYPDYKVFVASDSCSLVNLAKKKDFVFTIPGQPKHSDLPADNYDKEFVDFFIISGAEHVFLCKKGQMYLSGFPYYASLAGGKPFEIINY